MLGGTCKPTARSSKRSGRTQMEPVAQVNQFSNGSVTLRIPHGQDLIWMLGWLETIKSGILKQIDGQRKSSIAVPSPEAVGTLLNGVKQ